MDLSLLRNKNFMYLWTSQIMSNLAVNIMVFLVLVHLFEATGSSIASSFVWVAYGIPALVLGPIAAAAVDIYDRRTVLIVSNVIQAVVTLIYALLFQKYLYLSYGVVLGYSLMDQFYVPAETATLPTVVKKDKLASANGLFFLSQQSAAILGFGVAGIVVELIGFRQAMLFGSLMLVFATFVSTRLPSIKPARVSSGRNLEEKIFKFFTRMHEGYLFIRYRKTILYPFLFLMWMQISLSILVVNLPAIGTYLVQTKASLAGILTVGPGGLGALCGTLLVTSLIGKKVRKKKIIDTALLVSFFMFTFVSVVTPILPFFISRALLIAGFFFVGMAYVGALIPALTYLQVNTPRKFTGRVFGNFWFLTTVATMFPVLFSATITEILGIHLLLIGMGLISGSMLLVSRLYLSRSFNINSDKDIPDGLSL